MVKVKVKDMIVGNKYIVDGTIQTLISIEIVHIGSREDPYYKLIFDNSEKITDWQNEYEESTSGGKRKTRRNKKNRKSRKKYSKSKSTKL